MLETEIKNLNKAVVQLTEALAKYGPFNVAAAPSEKVAPAAEKEAVQASPAAATPSPLDDLAIVPEVKPEVTTEAPAATETATKDEVIAATIALAKGKGRGAPVEVFTVFGIKKATECPKARYGELRAALVAALA